VKALAEDWTVSDDGKTYTFKLRQDAKWSNGDPVTAHDFEYSWKRTLAKETAADYAYMLFYLVNGEKYNAGEVGADEVGVKALDDYTLEVKLNAPTPYFIGILAHNAYWPVHQASVEGKPDWATDVSTIVSNGPFLLTEWEHGSKLVLTKNPNYYDKDKVHFDKVTISLVEADSTVFNMYQTDKIDWIGAQAGQVPIDQVQKVLADGSAKIEPVASVYYYMFNTTKKPFNNAKIRKAFAMAVERQSLIDNVTKANQTPAHALVPPSILGVYGKKRSRPRLPVYYGHYRILRRHPDGLAIFGRHGLRPGRSPFEIARRKGGELGHVRTCPCQPSCAVPRAVRPDSTRSGGGGANGEAKFDRLARYSASLDKQQAGHDRILADDRPDASGDIRSDFLPFRSLHERFAEREQTA